MALKLKLNLYNTKIYDNIHGYIDVSNFATALIDTPIFQRLRYLHQLGTCYYVFPGAVQSRFEHSIGTYYLAGRLLECIRKKSDRKHVNECLFKISELQDYFKEKDINKDEFLDDYVCELIKIGGLCHDVGHGPFSHVFDDIFIPYVKKIGLEIDSKYDTHEKRSCTLLNIMIRGDPTYKHNNYGGDYRLKHTIPENHIKFIQNLINPTDEHTSFVYQIVSNSLNGIDVDKCDYIARDTYYLGLEYGFDYSTVVDDIVVINDRICYPDNKFYELSCLFSTRYRLHKQIYCHKAVIAVQSMICDIMILMDSIIGISKSINSMYKFINLTDSYVLESINLIRKVYENCDVIPNGLIHAQPLYECILNRRFYEFIGSVTSKKNPQFTLEKLKELDSRIDTNFIIMHSGKIGFVSGNKENPLDHIYFYTKKDYFRRSIKNKCSTIDKKDVSALFSNVYQEYITMIYYKKVGSSYSDKDGMIYLENAYNKMVEIVRKMDENE